MNLSSIQSLRYALEIAQNDGQLVARVHQERLLGTHSVLDHRQHPLEGLTRLQQPAQVRKVRLAYDRAFSVRLTVSVVIGLRQPLRAWLRLVRDRRGVRAPGAHGAQFL